MTAIATASRTLEWIIRNQLIPVLCLWTKNLFKKKTVCIKKRARFNVVNVFLIHWLKVFHKSVSGRETHIKKYTLKTMVLCSLALYDLLINPNLEKYACLRNYSSLVCWSFFWCIRRSPSFCTMHLHLAGVITLSSYSWVFFVYPVATAIIVWNHNSSKNLKYFSAAAGLISSLAYILMLGSMSQFVFLTYFFILATSLSSVLARLSMKIWRLLSSIRHHPTAHKH